MSTPLRKVHFEFSPGLVWCQAGRTSPGPVLMSPTPEDVTCKSCRHWLDEHARQQAEEAAAEHAPRPGDPRGPGGPS